jgi:L-ascorbate peroxidase
LKFDNEYYKNLFNPQEGLLLLESDKCLAEDPAFKGFAQQYADNNVRLACSSHGVWHLTRLWQDVFFNDYAVSHQKLSELGVQWTAEADAEAKVDA